MFNFRPLINSNKARQSGFTAFELIVVLIGFAIMIAILPWAYSSVVPDSAVVLPDSVRQKMVNISLLKSDISNAQSQLNQYKTKYGIYPATNDCKKPIDSTNICLIAYQGSVFDYKSDMKDSFQTYSLYTSKNGVARSFVVTDKQTIPVAVTSDK